MGAPRPSAAGVKLEPSVSQPPVPSAAALEQEAVSSPFHPAGRSLGPSSASLFSGLSSHGFRVGKRHAPHLQRTKLHNLPC